MEQLLPPSEHLCVNHGPSKSVVCSVSGRYSCLLYPPVLHCSTTVLEQVLNRSWPIGAWRGHGSGRRLRGCPQVLTCLEETSLPRQSREAGKWKTWYLDAVCSQMLWVSSSIRNLCGQKCLLHGLTEKLGLTSWWTAIIIPKENFNNFNSKCICLQLIYRVILLHHLKYSKTKAHQKLSLTYV